MHSQGVCSCHSDASPHPPPTLTHTTTHPSPHVSSLCTAQQADRTRDASSLCDALASAPGLAHPRTERAQGRADAQSGVPLLAASEGELQELGKDSSSTREESPEMTIASSSTHFWVDAGGGCLSQESLPVANGVGLPQRPPLLFEMLDDVSGPAQPNDDVSGPAQPKAFSSETKAPDEAEEKAFSCQPNSVFSCQPKPFSSASSDAATPPATTEPHGRARSSAGVQFVNLAEP